MVSLSGVAITLIDHLGLGGIGLGVFLNGLGVPGLSEVLLPLGGAGVSQGKFDLVGLIAIALVAQLLGLTAAYLIARSGGVTLVERYGKYLFISHRELAASQKAFDKYGDWLVLFGAFIPGIQGFIGYVAGLAELNYVRFIVSAFIGKIIWIGGLVYLGTILGDHIDLIDRVIKQAGVLVLALVIILAIWYVRRNRQRKGAIVED